MSDYLSLKKKYDSLIRQRDLAQAKNEQAEQHLKKLVQQIQAEFDVSSLAEAEELLATKEEEMQRLVGEIEQELNVHGV